MRYFRKYGVCHFRFSVTTHHPQNEGEGGSLKGQFRYHCNEIFCPFQFYEASIGSSVKFR